MVFTLLISGSPRPGNTEYILRTIYKRLKESKELLLLRKHTIKHCVGCLACHDKPLCVIDDDMTSIHEKLKSADMIVIGTPNYFDNVPGLMKDFIDRTHPFYNAQSLAGKRLVLIYVGGGRIDSTKEELDHSMGGIVKYLGLDLKGSFAFKALHADDAEMDHTVEKSIAKILSLIDLSAVS